MSRLNSGRGSKLGLYRTNGDEQLLPGSPDLTYTSYWGRFTNNPPEAFAVHPGNDYLDAILEGIGAESPGEFSRATLDAIDATENGTVSAAELVAAAEALRLDTGT